MGDLTDKWTAGPKDSPMRDRHAIVCLAEVISRFDVVALQEPRRNPKALKHLLATLGPEWQVIISDVTEGSAGNGERLAYVYDSRRVQPSGLVGEMVCLRLGMTPSASSPAPHTLPASPGTGSNSPWRPCMCSGAGMQPNGCRRSPHSPNG